MPRSRSSRRFPRTPRGADVQMSTARIASSVFLAASALGLSGCDDKKTVLDAGFMASSDAGRGGSILDASPSFATFVDASTVHPPVPARPDAPCRIIEASGTLTLGDAGARLHVGTAIPRGQPLELGPEAIATVKDGESGREIRLEGPARVVPCAGTDETWLLRGTLVMRPGTADQPFQELLVVVREGVIRLSSGAVVRIEAKPEGTRVTSRGRRPPVWTAKDVKLTWVPGDAGASEVATLTLPAAAASMSSAVGECEAAGKTSRDLGAKLLEKDAPIAELSPKSLEASRSERSACAVAKLRAFR